jgi:hypothetical protein
MLSAFTRNVSSPLSKFSLKYRRVRGALSFAGEDATRGEPTLQKGEPQPPFLGFLWRLPIAERSCVRDAAQDDVPQGAEAPAANDYEVRVDLLGEADDLSVRPLRA